MKPPLVLRPRPEQQPLLAVFVILAVLSIALPLTGIGSPPDTGSVFPWIAFGVVCLAVARPLRSRIVADGDRLEIRTAGETATFSHVTALYVWNKYLGVCDANGITIVRLRARWSIRQFDRLAATLGVPLTVQRDGVPRSATGPQMMADLMASGADVAGSDVVVRDPGKDQADVSRLVRILSESPAADPGTPPRARLGYASGAEVAKAAAALLDAGAQIRIER